MEIRTVQGHRAGRGELLAGAGVVLAGGLHGHGRGVAAVEPKPVAFDVFGYDVGVLGHRPLDVLDVAEVLVAARHRDPAIGGDIGTGLAVWPLLRHAVVHVLADRVVDESCPLVGDRERRLDGARVRIVDRVGMRGGVAGDRKQCEALRIGIDHR